MQTICLTTNPDTQVSDYTLAVSAADWSKYLKLKSEQSALEKQVKNLEQSFGFPDATELAESFQLPETESMSVRIVNGNNDTVGKYTVFRYPGATISAGWRKRIS